MKKRLIAGISIFTLICLITPSIIATLPDPSFVPDDALCDVVRTTAFRDGDLVFFEAYEEIDGRAEKSI